MKMDTNYLPNISNVLRFYIDKNDLIVKCDYIENFKGINHKEIKLRSEELRNLFKKYIENNEIYYEEKIYDRFVLYKFYDVNINEIDYLIKRSKIYQKNNINKFLYQNNRRVTRRNKFDGEKVIATIETICILLTSSVLIINATTKDSSTKNGKNINESVVTTTIDYNYQNSLPYNTEIIETKPAILYDQYIEVYTEDWTSNEKFTYVKENYYDLILKYSEIYGIDPKIALAIACQERGIHSNNVDIGGGIGLYQIQIEGDFNWDNQDVYAYNFETKTKEKYTIHKEEIANLENNIKAGLMIFQECLVRNNYDIAKSIQEYNYGYGNMQEVFKLCYTDKNPQTEENSLDWLLYRDVISGGDPNYLENVLKFINNDSVLEFKNEDGNIITCKYTNLSMNYTIKKIGP